MINISSAQVAEAPLRLGLLLEEFRRMSPYLVARWLGIVVMSGALFVAVVDCVCNSASPLRRFARRQIEIINSDLRQLHYAESGSSIFAIQALIVSVCCATALGVRSWAPAVGGIVATVVPRLCVGQLARRRRNEIENEVHVFALCLANSLKTTSSITDAIRIATAVTLGPLRQELEAMQKRLALGSSLDDTLRWAVGRLAMPPLTVLVSALLVGRRTGGNLPETLERVSKSLSESHRLKLLLESAQKDGMKKVFVLVVTTLVTLCMVTWMIPGVRVLDSEEGRSLVVKTAATFLIGLLAAHRALQVAV